MPELPEVETIRRQLEPELAGLRIASAWAFESAKFTPARRVVGARIDRIARRGKYLLVELDDERDLVVHLGMTGSLLITQPRARDPYERAAWDLDDGRRLRLRDVRRFGRVHVVARGDHAAIPTLATMGPEPLSDDFSAKGLHGALRSSRRGVKAQLLSQRPVAGIGNIYADEALWRAQIRPSARRVGLARATRLHDEIRSVISAAIDRRGTTFRDYRDATGAMGDNQMHLDCYGRTGAPCRRCGELLRGAVIDGRSTTWCGSCQVR